MNCMLFDACNMRILIFCCTVVLLALVGLATYRERCRKNLAQDPKEEAKNRNWKYLFWASIIVGVGIMIFSERFYGNRNVLDFISLASALISIILAVITIIYSFYTNSRSTGQMEKLNDAAEKVQKATISYSNSAESLQDNIQQILRTLQEVKEFAENTNKAINSPGSISSSYSSRSVLSGIKITEANEDKLITDYINAGSFVGNLGLLACVYCKTKDNKFTLSIFNFPESDNFRSGYVCGYIIASAAFGLVNAKINNDEIQVLNVRNDLQEKLELMIDNYINGQQTSEVKEYHKKMYDSLREIFDIK